MIPGPTENLEQFQKRQTTLSQAFDKFKQKYPDRTIQDIDGFPVYIGKKGLKLWEAGALWIYEDENDTRVPLIQLKTWNQEVFNHEKVHAQRLAFDESRFEELLAYYTSSKRWRKIFGPLFRNQIAVWIFLVCSFLPIIHLYLVILPIGFIFTQGIRLLYDRKKLLKVIDKLGSFDKALFLTDKEIGLFAKMSKKNILAYLRMHGKDNLRICKLMQLMS